MQKSTVHRSRAEMQKTTESNILPGNMIHDGSVGGGFQVESHAKHSSAP